MPGLIISLSSAGPRKQHLRAAAIAARIVGAVSSERQTVPSARDLVTRLLGSTVHTLSRRRPNVLLRIEGDDVVVATQTSPDGLPVPIASIQAALDRLVTQGELVVTGASLGTRNAFIGAVLSEIPGVDVHLRPSRLKLSPTLSEALGHGE